MKTWYIRWFNLKKGPQNHRSSAKNAIAVKNIQIDPKTNRDMVDRAKRAVVCQ